MTQAEILSKAISTVNVSANQAQEEEECGFEIPSGAEVQEHHGVVEKEGDGDGGKKCAKKGAEEEAGEVT